jgi:hypothetical protein
MRGDALHDSSTVDINAGVKAAYIPPKGERGICPSTRLVNYSRPQ